MLLAESITSDLPYSAGTPLALINTKGSGFDQVPGNVQPNADGGRAIGRADPINNVNLGVGQRMRSQQSRQPNEPIHFGSGSHRIGIIKAR